ncbi:cysteine synthase [Amycolatopsis mediterranei S699]|uniref:Cysteine synthase n=2 Tax=Amycolatopsis mediterranei TaxID=33910 RepID=A0A0H3D578_AMYMU|nr:2,3-diaminopropionate biosynthesis protein SbnA [Amycolatopsis mediterranei]ADJ45816.1 cysteine synthase [Amycolatopsis mediterranei U32]AEK42597.1 cysteine synthase [Amycolatopsis mediterranei S699]AFO77527.1 cysteine synthase [Amycolatopsis mediterranei S699]AGT84655.1 cysteine synthase [Amycolatopsis mediterranei RB]KDO05351.1 cysteine synthase [Amycolatopsis mediterranei]
MPIISAPQDFNTDDLFVDLRRFAGHPLYLKCEGFNFAGSIKIKAARSMVAAAERRGDLRPGSTLVESSSGNLGVALSLVAASSGYRFVCVTDSRCTLGARQLMETLGAEVRIVTEPHPEHGLLGARIELVRRLCAERGFVWLNQYENAGNWRAHYETTGPRIAEAFPDAEVVFIGAGTTGTLMGCARYLREHRPGTRVVAIDTVGSVTFGTPPARRMIPGLGTGIRPPMLDTSYVDDVVHVAEADTVRTCRALTREGFCFGGSTGTVVSGALSWLAGHAHEEIGTAVAIAPDLGGRYLDTVYHDQWVADLYGEDLLEGDPASRAAGLTR